MVRNRIGLGAVVALLCGLSIILGARTDIQAQTAELGERLAAIRRDVTSTEATITALKLDYNRFKSEQKHLTAEIARLIEEEQSMLERVTHVSRQKELLLVELKSAEQRLAQQQVKIRQRLRTLYMNSSVNTSYRIVVEALQSGQLERVAVYSRALRAHDQARFAEVAQAVKELLASRQALDAALAEGRELQGKLKVKREELETEKDKLRVVIDGIRDRQRSAKESLAKLMAEADKLESLMRVILSDEDRMREVAPDVGPIPLQIPEGDSDSVSPTSEPPTSATNSVMHPGGLFARTARLALPVRGEVLQKFGKTKVTSFADMVFSKGFEYKASEGSPVLAVLGGRVAFAGEMPGYESVVIIDHGERSYSLYGRLGKHVVRKGDLVGRGDKIGETSRADSKGRNFYFETRKNGSPVDPGMVLTRAS